MTDGEFVRLEVEDGIGTIRLDRPPMNALNVQVQEELRRRAAEAAERADVAPWSLYGGDKVFAAGADVKEMATMSYADMVVALVRCRRPSPPWRGSRSRLSPRSPATR